MLVARKLLKKKERERLTTQETRNGEKILDGQNKRDEHKESNVFSVKNDMPCRIGNTELNLK